MDKVWVGLRVVCALLFVLLMGGFLPVQGAVPEEAPNIVFILADDLGWGDLNCYGNTQVRTPNLDRLAAQGTLYTQFYVSGSVCSPSRTAFMTGHYPSRHSVHGHFATSQANQDRGMPNWLNPDATTITRLLKDAGYATAHFGKWHLGSGKGAPEPSQYGIQEFVTAGGDAFTSGPTWKQKDAYFRAKSTDLIVDETIRFIEANRNRPFYVNVWTLLTHATLNPTEEQLKGYERLAPGGGIPYKSARQVYLASVTALDSGLGRLFDRLDELGLSENTLIFFTSDNGPEDISIRNAGHSGVGSPGPFRGRKRSLYEGGVRMPLIVRWPDHVPAGKVNTTSVLAAVDFLPTVCKLTGVSLPAGYQPDGENVSDIFMGSDQDRSRELYWEWRFRIHGHVLNSSPQLVVRKANWKLLMNPDRSRIELYDIPNDPSELNNLAEHKPELVQEMGRLLKSWSEELPAGPRDDVAGRNDYPWPKPSRR